MRPSTKAIGAKGESEAARHLESLGYRILQKNYSTPFGEIDLVAIDKDTVCFVEVKARQSFDFGLAVEAVSKRKQRNMTKVAAAYLQERGWSDRKARFDVVAIDDLDQVAPRVEVFKNAFECA